ncbi:uncharacterized protein [Chiloscyllium punctatum]|uniref:uncharacterized protein n=1 Tax=Chiloscyllium punctatum TaxID=137246 RepID=UPI003B63B54C
MVLPTCGAGTNNSSIYSDGKNQDIIPNEASAASPKQECQGNCSDQQIHIRSRQKVEKVDSVKQPTPSAQTKHEVDIETLNKTPGQKKNDRIKLRNVHKQTKMNNCKWKHLTDGKTLKPHCRKIAQAENKSLFVKELMERSTLSRSSMQIHNVKENAMKCKSILSGTAGFKKQRRTRRENIPSNKPHYRLRSMCANVLSKRPTQNRKQIEKQNDEKFSLVTQIVGAYDIPHSEKSSKVLFPKEYRNKATKSCHSKPKAKIQLKKRKCGRKFFSTCLSTTFEEQHNGKSKTARDKASIVQFEVILPEYYSSPLEIAQCSEDKLHSSISGLNCKDNNRTVVPGNKCSEPVDRLLQLEKDPNLNETNPAFNTGLKIHRSCKGSANRRSARNTCKEKRIPSHGVGQPIFKKVSSTLTFVSNYNINS